MENTSYWVRHRAGMGPAAALPSRPLSRSRAAVLELLRDQPEPVTLAALVRIVRLHENTVREHVDALVGRGLVRRSRAEPSGRGRPAWLYETTEVRTPTSEYPGTAAAVAAAYAGVGSARERALRAGEAWGRRLANDRGAEPMTPEVARAGIVRLLAELGFAPERAAEPETVRLTRCPLLESAHRNTEVACTLHLGIVRGALETHRADPTGTDLVPFAEPGACRLVIPPLPAA